MSEPESTSEQHERGEYQEWLQMLVDGVMEDVASGHLRTRRAVDDQLSRHLFVRLCGDTERQRACAEQVLTYASQPMIAFMHSELVAKIVATAASSLGSFPLLHDLHALLAVGAVSHDCEKRLLAIAAYTSLPQK